MWGEKNKLAVHVRTGIPVDFFAATEANWWNYLVCRTGGEQNNIAIASHLSAAAGSGTHTELASRAVARSLAKWRSAR